MTTVLSILHNSRRGADHLELGAHFLDLGGLLSELGCESLYLFLLLRDRCLLLRDRCLQLLNFLIERGVVRGAGGAREVEVRYDEAQQVRHRKSHHSQGGRYQGPE